MKKLLSALIIFSVTVIFSCKKSITTTNTPSLQTLISSDSTLSIFNAAITRTGETALLQQTGNFTLIVPVNAAFIANALDLTAINAMPVTQLDSLVKYLFITGLVQPASVTDSAIVTLTNLPIYGSTDGTNIFFNGSTAIKQNTSTGNALVYETNGLPMPPVYSLAQYLQSDPSLSLLNEAMTRTGIINNFSSGWYTLFAPDNASFAAAGYPDIASIDNADLTTLTNLINYQISNAAYFGNRLAGTIPTDEGVSIVATNTGGTIQIAGHSNSGLIMVTRPNILLTGNIIVHRTNGVLLP